MAQETVKSRSNVKCLNLMRTRNYDANNSKAKWEKQKLTSTALNQDILNNVLHPQWYGMFISSLIGEGVNWFRYTPFSRDEEEKDAISNRNICVCSLSRSPYENFPKFWGVYALLVFEACRRAQNLLFAPLSAALHAELMRYTASRKGKVNIGLLELRS